MVIISAGDIPPRGADIHPGAIVGEGSPDIIIVSGGNINAISTS
jgi:hypothetical protein